MLLPVAVVGKYPESKFHLWLFEAAVSPLMFSRCPDCSSAFSKRRLPM